MISYVGAKPVTHALSTYRIRTVSGADMGIVSVDPYETPLDVYYRTKGWRSAEHCASALDWSLERLQACFVITLA